MTPSGKFQSVGSSQDGGELSRAHSQLTVHSNSGLMSPREIVSDAGSARSYDHRKTLTSLLSCNLSPSGRRAVNRAMCPVITEKNAMQVHTDDTLAGAIPFCGDYISDLVFELNQRALFHVIICLMWICGFASGCSAIFLPEGHFYSRTGIRLTLLMLPAELFPWLLFNRQIFTAILTAFETWFLLMNLLVPLFALCVMVGLKQFIFILSAMPGVLLIPFMDAYPVYLRGKIIKVYTIFYFAFWAFWMVLVYFPMGSNLVDYQLYELGRQKQLASQTCAAAIGTILAFGLRNLWFAFRHPRWFVVLKTPLETIMLGNLRDALSPNLSSSKESLVSSDVVSSTLVSSQDGPTGNRRASKGSKGSKMGSRRGSADYEVGFDSLGPIGSMGSTDSTNRSVFGFSSSQPGLSKYGEKAQGF
eukprot:gnl/MRDRNA2_/MRDRNA2_235857_c0_seq1.p1 gnl/MRDRNA2_/MRDRNA2_235857_c0~~gnl/MRDRNA2_/MRDRNA2_235857_c0_seq1.p1  ORF type:complete len:490 (+),score=33.97 gnl/MRDRNA2_/MRDRNA2_235857_c0_seq1:222-1472(+)